VLLPEDDARSTPGRSPVLAGLMIVLESTYVGPLVSVRACTSLASSRSAVQSFLLLVKKSLVPAKIDRPTFGSFSMRLSLALSPPSGYQSDSCRSLSLSPAALSMAGMNKEL